MTPLSTGDIFTPDPNYTRIIIAYKTKTGRVHERVQRIAAKNITKYGTLGKSKTDPAQKRYVKKQRVLDEKTGKTRKVATFRKQILVKTRSGYQKYDAEKTVEVDVKRPDGQIETIQEKMGRIRFGYKRQGNYYVRQRGPITEEQGRIQRSPDEAKIGEQLHGSVKFKFTTPDGNEEIAEATAYSRVQTAQTHYTYQEMEDQAILHAFKNIKYEAEKQRLDYITILDNPSDFVLDTDLSVRRWY